ncbi:MAG: tetratricopeptide repeat protein [Myxococcota bacterium]
MQVPDRFSRLSRSLVSTWLAASLALVFAVALGGCADDADRIASFMKSGEDYVEKEKFDEAVIEFKNVLQIDPEHPGAHEALSLAYLQTEKPREAYWEMSETVRLDPKNVEARLRYGTVSAAIGEHDVALEQAEAVLAIDPESAPAFILRAQGREAKEDFEGAEADFRSAIEADPQGPAYRFLYSGFLERRGRFEDAERVLRELIEVEESYLAYSSLVRLVARTKNRDDEAEALLRKTVELAAQAPVEEPKRDPKEKAGTSTSLVTNFLREEAVQNAYLLLSTFHYTRGRFDEAIRDLEQGVSESASKIELIYQMARLNRLEGRLDEEAALIRRATEEAPDSLGAQLVLSLYLGQQGDLDGALAAAERAVAIDPKNRGAELRVAELLADIGYKRQDEASMKKAREMVDAILEKEPDSPEARFVDAKLKLTQNDLAGAKSSLEIVLQAKPDWAQAHFVLGSTLVASGEFARARVELARAVELDPQLLDARKLLARVHAQLGEHEFAIEQGRAYLAQRPDDGEVRIVVGQSLIRVGRSQEAYEEVEKIPEEKRDAAAQFALGRLDLAFGRVEQGKARLLKADALAPGNAQVLRSLLAVDREQGKLAESAARIDRAAQANPSDSQLAELQGEVALLRGETESGRKALSRAIELDGRNVTAQLTLAELAQREGKPEEMIGILERAAESVPESADLQYRLAVVYEQNDRRADAITAYEKAIKLNNDLAMAKNNLAYLMAESGGDLDRALELAQQAKEQMPDDGNAADTLGWVMLKRGVPSAAIGYLEEARGRFPQDAHEVQGIVRNHLAEAYEKNQEPDKAITESRKSIEFGASMVAAAKKRGVTLEEPSWSVEARQRIERLGAQG